MIGMRSALKRGSLVLQKSLEKKALDYIIENPVRTVWLSIKKVAYFWMPPIHERQSEDYPFIESVAKLVWLIYYCPNNHFGSCSAIRSPVKLIARNIFYMAQSFLYCAIHA